MSNRLGFKTLIFFLLSLFYSIPALSNIDSLNLPLNVPPCNDRAYWSKVANGKALNHFIELSESIVAKQIPSWVNEKYLDYSISGSRIKGEQMIRDRSFLLAPLVIAECLTWNGDYLPYIVSLINSYLDEPSWTLPAHDPNLMVFRGELQKVDLAVASRAYELALSHYLLKSKVSADFSQRLLKNLQARVWKPVLNSIDLNDNHNWWLFAESNWNAVCLKGVVLSALVAEIEPNQKKRFVTIANTYISHFLATYSEDGYALEGPNYWGYGFGAFVELSYGLSIATNNEINLFKLPKVDQIALYPFRFQMSQGNVAAFGDAQRNVRFDPVLLSFLNSYLHFESGLDWAKVATDFKKTPSGSLSLILMRLASLPELEFNSSDAKSASLKYFYFENEGVLKSCGEKEHSLCITMKAAGNGQAHSHNDVGSYVIGLDNEQPAGDVGSGVYSKKTFSSKRESIRWVGSWGHPVPLVDGAEQVPSKLINPSYALQRQDSNSRMFTLDLSNAYDKPNILKLRRIMVHYQSPGKEINIQDDFEFSDKKDFEVAVTTLGQYSIKSENEIILTEKKLPVSLKVTASSPFEFIPERVSDEGLTFNRVAIRFKEKQKKGWIRQSYIVD